LSSSFPPGLGPPCPRVAGGRGVDESTARLSGIGEAVELASLCRWRDPPADRVLASDPSGQVWTRDILAGFSDAQRADRESWNARMRGTDWIPPEASSAETEWVAATDLDGNALWVPAECVFLEMPDAGKAAGIADTNGCAGGETDRDARSRALFELLERDATGRWWYGRRARGLLSEDSLGEAVANLVENFRRVDIRPRLFDITTDIGVATVAAAGISHSGKAALGFAAAANFPSAALRALTEMGQMSLVLRPGGAALRADSRKWLQEVSSDTSPITDELPDAAICDPTARIGSRLRDAGVRIAFVNQTRPELGIPVWRALSPDLCHWKPRFGRPRLLSRDDRDLLAPQSEPNPVLLRL